MAWPGRDSRSADAARSLPRLDSAAARCPSPARLHISCDGGGMRAAPSGRDRDGAEGELPPPAAWARAQPQADAAGRRPEPDKQKDDQHDRVTELPRCRRPAGRPPSGLATRLASPRTRAAEGVHHFAVIAGFLME